MNKAAPDILVRISTLLAIVAFALCGCSSVPTIPTSAEDLVEPYHPSNIFSPYKILPSGISRVALLPLTTTSDDSLMEGGTESLEPLIYSELEKIKRFEVIPVSPVDLKRWTGRTGWRTEEVLPADFFKHLQDSLACNAVMFCQLTRYHPYQPVSVGWKFSLVQLGAPSADKSTNALPSTQIIWSADELLDSGDARVASAARAYYNRNIRNDAPAEDVSTMMSSPLRFGQYTISTILGTIPDRPLASK
jgi:hypothetical protein